MTAATAPTIMPTAAVTPRMTSLTPPPASTGTYTGRQNFTDDVTLTKVVAKSAVAISTAKSAGTASATDVMH